jgi:predicted permease
VFGIARPLVFNPLPYANTGQVGAFWMTFSWTEEEFLFLRGQGVPGFRTVAAYTQGDVTLRQGDAPARLLPGIATSAELFDVLGTRPALGRGFQRGEDLPGAEPVAVISHGLWQELGGDAGVVGRRIVLDGAPRTVVGVMPRGFWFPSPDVRVWTPVPLSPEHRSGNYTLLGLAAPGQDVRAMEGALRQLTALLGRRFEYPMAQWDKTREPEVTPLRDFLVGSMRPALLATLAAMGLILLMACANVAALMLGQVEGRSTELAVRSALGAHRRRLVQQLVVEALAIGLGAGLAGALLAAGAFGWLARALPLGAWAENARFDWSVFLASLALAVAAALLVVLVPSTSLWRGDLRGALSRARTGGIQGRGGRLERGLVVAEVALAMLIASGAALLVRSVSNLYAIDPGFPTARTAVLDVVLPGDQPRARRQQLLAELTQALAQLPGVASAAATHKIPLRGPGSNTGMAIEGQAETAERSTTFFRIVTPGYLETLGLPLRSGRTYTERDLAADSGAYVMVVNEALVKKYFAGANPIGRRVATGFGGWAEIVGVVGDAAEGDLTGTREPARYNLVTQVAFMPEAQTLVVRLRDGGDPAALLDAARRTVQRVAPGVAVQQATTMGRVLDVAVGPARQVMALLALLAALALLLGAVGIYGVIAHFAARRRRDWAIQVALGLPGARVVRRIVGQGATLVGAGIAIGALATAGLSRTLASFLYGVGGVDPVAFAAASAALLAVGLVAAFLPARRAGTVSPATILREE